MAGRKETPGDRARRDEALTASAADAEEAAREAVADANAEAAEHLKAMAAAATTDVDRAFVASAARIMLNDRRSLAALRRARQAWQSEAWDYIDEIGECGYTVAFAANMIAKIRLFPAVKQDPKADPVPVDAEPGEDDNPDDFVPADVAEIAVAMLERLRSPQGGQASLLRALDWNFEVAGEAYLHGHEDSATGEAWYVRSVDELVSSGEKFVLRTAMSSTAVEDVPGDDLTIRLWDPSPRFGDLAVSPMRRVLSVCENLLLLTRAMRADAMSHLNNGLLLKPQELSPGPADPTSPEADGETDDPFEANIRETVIAPIEQPGSAAAVAPSIVTGPAEYLKPDVFRHLTFSRPLDALLGQWIEGLVMRLARGLNMPVEVTTGLQECVDAETEILTADGWHHHSDLAEGDLVLTLNHDTGVAEWQAVQRVARYDVSGQELLSIDRKCHSSMTTLNHRWPVIWEPSGERVWRTSETLNSTHRFQTAAPLADAPAEAKWSDDFVEIVAWFYTEGSVDRRGHRGGGGVAIISQSDECNRASVARIRAALARTFGPARDKLNGTGPTWKNPARPQVAAWTEGQDPNRPIVRFRLSHLATALLEEAAPDRVPTHDFLRSLTRAQLELFLEVSRLADGWTVNTGTRMFSQTDRRRLDAYEFAAILSGRTTSTWTVQGTGRYADWVQHYCSITDRTTVAPLNGSGAKGTVRREVYTGVVWCPQVPNGTWLARRHGRIHFTGNTTFANAVQVKKSEWDAHGEPRAVLICEALTAGYYRDALAEALAEAGLDRSWADRIFIWYDPAGAIAAPDPVDSADVGVEKGLIRAETWRRVKGFSDDDAPGPDEVLLAIAHEAPRMDPFMAAQLWRRTGIFPEVLIPLPQSGGYIDQAGNVVQTGADSSAVAAAVVRQLVAAGVVAAPRPRAGKGRRLGRRLAAIDRELRTRTLVACEAAMRRFLELAGAKVRTRVAGRGKDDAAARAAAAAPLREMCARLGREVVTAAGVSEADLLAGAFDELADDFAAWVDVAQAQAVAAVDAAAGLTAGQRAALEAAQPAARARAAEALKAAMQQVAARRLYDPSAGASAAGEQDVTSTVPAWVVRQAMAIAGGDQPEGGDGAPMRSAGGGPVGGVATGPDVSSAAGGAEAYVWDYGSAPRRPFEPHLDLDGTEFANFDDDVLVNDGGWPDVPYLMPGDHDGCFPAGTVVSGPPVRGSTLRWYEGEVVDLAFASGQLLTATPNHPILTDQGWVPAGLLDESSNVVRCLAGEGIAALVPGYDERPALIEDVARSFGEALGVVPRTVPVAAEHFHGDGGGSQVAVVRSDGLLRDRRHAPLFEPVGQEDLAGRDADAVLLAGDGGGAEAVEGVGATPLGLEGVGRDLAPPFRCSTSGDDELLLTHRADADAALAETSGDRDAVDADLLGQNVDRLAGLVQLDKVVHLSRREFAGHVYNLHTSTGWYIANGTVVHNCVCDVTPVLVLGGEDDEG